ncbi:MAG TPA: ABC transporter substrate-binding protein [Burkholderiales bacterium]|nr:ABC transporter substrate-binding protein [Burkholderiales bacterium]
MTLKPWVALAALTAATAAYAQQPTKFTMQTNWRAQAEHGGYYQAVATGIYKKYNLDVTLKAGGPQINLPQLLAANSIDFMMGSDSFGGLNYVKNNIPLVVVGSIFQKDPRVLIAHPGQGNDSLAELKGKPILIASASRNNYWQFLRAKYGYSDDQIRAYTFNMAPFLADKSTIQQGFLTSEPLKAIKAGVKPVVHLLADNGYVSYATTIETRQQLVKEQPDAVQRFVNATIEGWYTYLYGDRTAANALIKKDNPEMDDEQLAYSHSKMLEHGIVDSGDALKLGIGAMTDARWREFADTMIKAGVYPADLDVSKAYTLQFVNKAHGMSLKRKN